MKKIFLIVTFFHFIILTSLSSFPDKILRFIASVMFTLDFI
jgi:hypothetical protein